ncbi:MAG TPA: hypothetical protein VLK82_09070 [Candidatus Tectomicrobia bacterium]|nr:hypothetical protein [Candidatus Tectomicrobia bacterium]
MDEQTDLQKVQRLCAAVGQGDKVLVFGYERALAKPTDRSFESDWVMVFTLRTGQVVRFRAYHDTAAMVIAFRSLTTYQV